MKHDATLFTYFQKKGKRDKLVGVKGNQIVVVVVFLIDRIELYTVKISSKQKKQ